MRYLFVLGTCLLGTAILIAIALLVVRIHDLKTSENMSLEWFELFEKCRPSIETGKPLNTSGLFAASLDRKERAHQRKW